MPLAFQVEELYLESLFWCLCHIVFLQCFLFSARIVPVMQWFLCQAQFWDPFVSWILWGLADLVKPHKMADQTSSCFLFWISSSKQDCQSFCRRYMSQIVLDHTLHQGSKVNHLDIFQFLLWVFCLELLQYNQCQIFHVSIHQ